MPTSNTARLARLHFSEADRYLGRPLYEAVIDKCRELKIAGATVFRGLEGFGESAEIHRAHLIANDRPIVVTIVDSKEAMARLLPAMEEMIGTGLIAVSGVEVIRMQKSKQTL
jgi:PII-like signaling protein